MKNKKALLIGGLVLIVIIAVGVGLFATQKSPQMKPSSSLNLELPAIEQQAPAQQPAPEPQPLVYPLTGLPADDEAATLRRILSVKIENTPDARPQMGFTSADVVYETVTEGGITRFNCLFQSTVPTDVGPVRSGRNSDVTIVPQYDAIVFMSGANSLVHSPFKEAGFPNLGAPKAGDLYYRVDYREAPHNMYLHLDRAYDKAASKDYATSVEKAHALEFGETDTGGAPDVIHITVPFSYSYVAEWSWSAEEGVYYRSMDGPTLDTDGTQVSATNVVVLWAEYVPIEFKGTLELDMNAGGKASVFIDGKRVDGTYKSDGKTPPRFEDAQGKPLKLNPGKTWFQVIDLGDEIITG
jgi:hypothetical protein